jgi:hypothetical protein
MKDRFGTSCLAKTVIRFREPQTGEAIFNLVRRKPDYSPLLNQLAYSK